MHDCLAIDTETTGNTPNEVIELYYSEVFLHELPDESKLIEKPKYYFPKGKMMLGALSAHNITESMLVGYPLSTDAPRDLPPSLFILAHNVDYDWDAIGKPDTKKICTLSMARRLFPDIDSHKLASLMYFFYGEDARPYCLNAHSAKEDVRMLCIVMYGILKEMRSRGMLCGTWSDIWEFSEFSRIPTHFTFGKHKGDLIADAPIGYRKWFLNQEGADPYLLNAIIASLP